MDLPCGLTHFGRPTEDGAVEGHIGSVEGGGNGAGMDVGGDGAVGPIAVETLGTDGADTDGVLGLGCQAGEGVSVASDRGRIDRLGPSAGNGSHLIGLGGSTFPVELNGVLCDGDRVDSRSDASRHGGPDSDVVDADTVEAGGVVPTEADGIVAIGHIGEADGVENAVGGILNAVAAMDSGGTGIDVLNGNEVALIAGSRQVTHLEEAVGAVLSAHPEGHGERVGRLGNVNQTDVGIGAVVTSGSTCCHSDGLASADAVAVRTAVGHMRIDRCG